MGSTAFASVGKRQRWRAEGDAGMARIQVIGCAEAKQKRRLRASEAALCKLDPFLAELAGAPDWVRPAVGPAR